MAKCLIALGSNLGQRAATLDSAVRAMGALPGVKLIGCSRWYLTPPLGCTGNQPEFLNGAALIETTREPDELHRILQQIEADHGRQRRARWDARTLDLDLLLYDERVIDSPSLTVPHPRMSFRRFVLEPAGEIAGRWVHPTIGWTLEELRNHLDAGADCLAMVSPSERLRRDLAAALTERYTAEIIPPPAADDLAQRWPAGLTTWISMPAVAEVQGRTNHAPTATDATTTYPAADLPKLTILLDPPPLAAEAVDVGSVWTAVAQQPGRGPTLRIPSSDMELVLQEALAAVETVWPGR